MNCFLCKNREVDPDCVVYLQSKDGVLRGNDFCICKVCYNGRFKK